MGTPGSDERLARTPTFSGVSHISFSVSDCEKTATWWKRVFDLPDVVTLDEDGWRAVILDLPGGIGLEFQQHDANEGERFDPVRTGVDHMGLAVEHPDELEVWEAHFRELGVDHTPTVTREYGSVLTFRDPDGIQFEMFYLDPAMAPPSHAASG